MTERYIGVLGMSRRGPSLEDVAREAGVSRATLSWMVTGTNVDPAVVCDAPVILLAEPEVARA